MRKKNRKTKREEMDVIEQDEHFYYIVGYTSGGAPYGITWEQAYEDGLLEEAQEEIIPDEEFPF